MATVLNPATMDPSGLFTLFAGFMIISFALSLALYIFFALGLMSMAKKTNTENGWLAFIPVANLYLMSQIAGVGWWTMFLTFIPIVNIFITIWWYWKIAQNLNRSGWWSILLLIPIVNLIIFGIMAWGNKKPQPPQQQSTTKQPKQPKKRKTTSTNEFNKDPWK